MGLTLEIDTYTDLDTLENDIAEAAKSNANHIYDKETPMKVELSKEDYIKLESDLRTDGSYKGIRNTKEFMHNQWAMKGIQISFFIRKENGVI